MEESTTREKVLKAIRDALVNPMDSPFFQEDYSQKIYAAPETEYPEVAFAEAFARVGGNFVYCADEQEFALNIKELLLGKGSEQIHCYESSLQSLLNQHGIFCINAPEEFKECVAGITSCEYLIARLGSIMVSSRLPSGRKGFIIPEVHCVVAWRNQLVSDLKDALEGIRKRYTTLPSMITTITGPSRTADIEKTLVMGAHGPKELFVFFIDQEAELEKK